MYKKEIVFYETESGKKPFYDWFKSLDKKTKERILVRLNRLQEGNSGDFKYLDEDIYELKLRFGSGYRIYYGNCEDIIVLILCGGDKSSQLKDFQKAKTYFKDFKERIK